MGVLFDCPSCGSQTPKLVIYQEPRKLGCPNCGVPKPIQHNVNLGQTVETYIRNDGSKGRLTTGKAWEINNRVTRDGTVVNSKTGKEAQY